MSWETITADPEFQAQPVDVRRRVADNYFARNIEADPEFRSQPSEVQSRVRQRFYSKIPTSTTAQELGKSAARFGYDVSAKIPGVAMATPEAAAQTLADAAAGFSPSRLGVTSRPRGVPTPEQMAAFELENQRRTQGQNLVAGTPDQAAPPTDSAVNRLAEQGLGITQAASQIQQERFPVAPDLAKQFEARDLLSSRYMASRIPQNLGQTGLALAAAAAGQPEAAVALYAGGEASGAFEENYNRLIAQGMTPGEARRRAGQAAGVTGALNAAIGAGLPIEATLGKLVAGKVARIPVAAAIEAGTEAVEQNTPAVVARQFGDKTQPGPFFGPGTAEAAVFGAIGGTGGATISSLAERATEARAPEVIETKPVNPPPVEPAPQAQPAAPVTPPLTTPQPQAQPQAPTQAPEAPANARPVSRKSSIKPAERARFEGALARAQEQIVQSAQRGGSDVSATPRLALDDQADTPELNAARRFGRLTGLDIIPVTKAEGSADLPFNGYWAGENAILINTQSKNPVHAVAGHEILHAMETELGADHDAVIAYREAVKAAAETSGGESYQTYLERTTGEPYSPESAMNELRADYFAEQMIRPTFWKRLAEIAPFQAFRKLAQKFLDTVAQIKTALPVEYQTGRFLNPKGLREAEKTARNLLIQYQIKRGLAVPKSGKATLGETAESQSARGPNETAADYAARLGRFYRNQINPPPYVEPPNAHVGELTPEMKKRNATLAALNTRRTRGFDNLNGTTIKQAIIDMGGLWLSPQQYAELKHAGIFDGLNPMQRGQIAKSIPKKDRGRYDSNLVATIGANNLAQIHEKLMESGLMPWGQVDEAQALAYIIEHWNVKKWTGKYEGEQLRRDEERRDKEDWEAYERQAEEQAKAGQPQEQPAAAPTGTEEESDLPYQRPREQPDLSEQMRLEQARVTEAKPSETTQPSLFKPQLGGIGQPSVEAKIGPAPKQLPGQLELPFQKPRFTPEELKARAQQAAAETPGQFTIGEPRLALGADNPIQRAIDDLRTESAEIKSDKVTQAQAQQILASPDFRERVIKKGEAGEQLTDAETLAAKTLVRKETQALYEQADPNMQDFERVAQLADAYRETRTAQARAFRQGQDPTLTPAQRFAQWVSEEITSPDDATRAALEKAKAIRIAARRNAEVSAIYRKWAKQSHALIRRLKALGVDLSDLETAFENPRKAARITRELATAKEATAFDKVYEFWLSSILSGPTTHIANITGNTMMSTWELTAQRTMEALVNTVVRDPESAQLGELRHLYAGLIPGFARGARNALLAYDTESAILEEEVMGEKGARGKAEHRPAIAGKTGRVIRAPLRGLLAEDEFQKAIIAQMEAGAQAYRIAKSEGKSGEDLSARINELTLDHQSLAWQQALESAKEFTFQKKLGRLGQGFGKLLEDFKPLRFIIPFKTTIGNIFKAGVRKSPIGTPISLLRGLDESLVKIGWKTHRSGLWDQAIYSRKLIVRDIAEQGFAWGMTYLLMALTGERDKDGLPRITGSVAWRGGEKGQREMSLRTAPPFSIRIGDQYYSYARIEPFATTIGLTVDLLGDVHEAASGEDFAKAYGDLHQHLIGQMRDKTFMNGIVDIIDAIDNEKTFGKWAANFASSFIPNIIRQAGRAGDPSIREMKVFGENTEWWKRLASRTGEKAFPFGGNRPPAKVTPWGEDIQKSTLGSPQTDFFFRMLSPAQMTDLARRDPDALKLDRALINFNNKYPEDQWWPILPEPSFTEADTKIWMNEQEYYDFLKRAGQLTLKVLKDAPIDPDNPTLADVTLIKTALEAGRDVARGEMLQRKRETVMPAIRKRTEQIGRMLSGQ